MTADQIIMLSEKNKHDMSENFKVYVTIDNIDNLSPESIFVAFMNSVSELVDMDASDYADNCNVHPEWVAERCWERMHPEYREQILAAIPHIQNYMEWQGIDPENSWEFREFYANTFHRLIWCEKAEIIKRAQTKMLKEEIVMKTMHPARIEKVASTHGMDFDDYLNILD